VKWQSVECRLFTELPEAVVASADSGRKALFEQLIGLTVIYSSTVSGAGGSRRGIQVPIPTVDQSCLCYSVASVCLSPAIVAKRLTEKYYLKKQIGNGLRGP